MRQQIPPPTLPRTKGFTLIELVITILISSILAVGIISYIGDAVNGFVSSGSRNKLASSGRVVVDRLALELHNAVPNSVRVSSPNLTNGNQCLEFIPFIGATNYLDAPFSSAGSSISAVTFNPSILMSTPAGVYAAIYPIDTDDLYTAADPGPLTAVDAITTASGGRVTLNLDLAATVPVEAHRFSRRSPVDRLYLATQPVSFCIVEDKLFRYENYGFNTSQCLPAGQGGPCDLPSTSPNRALVSDSIDNTSLTAFVVVAQSLRRNALVSVDVNFTDEFDVIRLKHEVLLRNVP